MSVYISVAEYLDELRAMFSFPVTMTLVIRSDKMPGSQDIILTDDDLDQVAGVLLRRGDDEGLH